MVDITPPLRADLEGRAPASDANRQARHLRYPLAFEPGRPSVPELVGRLGGHRRLEAHQTSGGALPSSATAVRFIVRAYPLQTHEMLFDAHNHAFRVLGGVPRRRIYDNMRTAVDRIGRGKERQVNARFSAMASHYLFETGSAIRLRAGRRDRSGRTSGCARHRLWQPMPRRKRLNGWLEQRCRELWQQIPHGLRPRHDRRHPGRGSTVPDAMPRLFDSFVRYTKQVSPACLVHLERNRYSVPASLPTGPVSLRVYPEPDCGCRGGGRSCASTAASSSGRMTAPVAPSTTGVTIWRV